MTFRINKSLPVILLKMFVVFGIIVKTLMFIIQALQLINYQQYIGTLSTIAFFWLIGTFLSVGLLLNQKWAWTLSFLVTIVIEGSNILRSQANGMQYSLLSVVFNLSFLILLFLSRDFYMKQK